MRLLSYYGDDFTGSTDVMEALASHGVETVLFTRIPTAEEFAPFADHQVFGLAGLSRSQSPAWMDEHLPPIFAWLKSLGARYAQYKVCSTFDSSPALGNIGRATEIGLQAFGQAMAPMIVGAPQLKRYTQNGVLSAGYQGETYRIDKHPVMSRHPVTPMLEPDLLKHLALQSNLPSTIVRGAWPESGIGFVDVFDLDSQIRAGKRLLDWQGGFLVGSSGVEYALVAAQSLSKKAFAPLKAVDQTVVISGSVSPTTERQIRYSTQNGFTALPIDAVELASEKASLGAIIETALQLLNEGKSPIIHTALGPASDAGSILNAIPHARQKLGEGLGIILRALIERTKLRRVLVAGGDTSSHALGQLDIFALTTRMPLPKTPGSPLCIAASNNQHLSGLEIALKGGQVGDDAYFVNLRDGVVN
jgi:uncharacterized protein YgbK (DUF1537 family)